MASIDERVVVLEGRAEGQGHMINGIREAVARLEVRIASLETRMDQRLLAFEARVDQRFQSFDTRLQAVEFRMNQGFEAVDAKMTRYFTWLIGLYVTGLTAVVATSLAALFAR